MLIAVLSGYAMGLFAPLLVRILKGAAGIAVALLPALLFAWFLQFLPDAAAGTPWQVSYPWVPDLGVSLYFQASGLSLFFCFIICSLAFVAALCWRDARRRAGANPMALASLMCLMASALGLVLSQSLAVAAIFSGAVSVSALLLLASEPRARVALFAVPVWAFWVAADCALVLAAGLLAAETGVGSFDLRLPDGAAPSLAVTVSGALVYAALLLKMGVFPFGFIRVRLGWLSGLGPFMLYFLALVPASVCLLIKFSMIFGGQGLWCGGLITAGVLGVAAALPGLLRGRRIGDIAAAASAMLASLCVLLVGVGGPLALSGVAALTLLHSTNLAAVLLLGTHLSHKLQLGSLGDLPGGWVAAPFVTGVWGLAALSTAGLFPSVGAIALDRALGAFAGRGMVETSLTTALLLFAFAAVGFGLTRVPASLLREGPPPAARPGAASGRGTVLLAFALCLVGAMGGLYPRATGNFLIGPALSSVLPGEVQSFQWSRHTLWQLAVPWSFILVSIIYAIWRSGTGLPGVPLPWRRFNRLQSAGFWRFGWVLRGRHLVSLHPKAALFFWLSFVTCGLLVLTSGGFAAWADGSLTGGAGWTEAALGLVGAACIGLAVRVGKPARASGLIGLTGGVAGLAAILAGAKTLGFALMLFGGVQSVLLSLAAVSLDHEPAVPRPPARRLRDGAIAGLVFAALLSLLTMVQPAGAGGGQLTAPASDAIALLVQHFGARFAVLLSAIALAIWVLTDSLHTRPEKGT